MIIACHGITKFTLKGTIVILFSAVNHTFDIITILASVAAAYGTYPCMYIKLFFMNGTNCQNKHLPENFCRFFDLAER